MIFLTVYPGRLYMKRAKKKTRNTKRSILMMVHLKLFQSIYLIDFIGFRNQTKEVSGRLHEKKWEEKICPSF